MSGLEQKKTDPDGNREDTSSEENDMVDYEAGHAQYGAHDGQTLQEGSFPRRNELFDGPTEFLTATVDPYPSLTFTDPASMRFSEGNS
jgi:hypothetical protein